MVSRTYRTAVILVVVACLLWGILAKNAQVLYATSPSLEGKNALTPTAVVVYSQPPSPSGGLIPSSLRDPDGSDTDQWAWDGFTIGWTQVITEVQWRGAYDPALAGSGGAVNDFIVDIYASILGGFQPDLSQRLAHYAVGGNANETLAGMLGGVQTYDYRFALPGPFEAAARTKYWVQIEAYQPGAPDWALVKGTGGDGVYFRDNGYIQQLVSGDAAFTLLAPGIIEADLGLTKVDAVDPVMEGDDIVYTVTVSNAGPEAAQNVVLTDQLPVGVTYVSAVPDQGSCGQAAGVVTCNLGEILASGSASVVLTVTTTAPGTLTNSASVTSDTMDPNETDNSASEDTTVNAAPVPEADLSITKADGADPVDAGSVLTYTLLVTNSGPDAAAATTVTDALPPQVVYDSASGAGWSCDQSGGTVTCTRPNLPVEMAPAIVITVTAPTSGGIITNSVSVESTTSDPNPANNMASETTVITAPPVPEADLAIAKVDTPDPVNAGAILTYTLTVTNNGPNPATAVTVTDTLPVEVTYGGASGTGWNCGHAGGEVVCTRPDLGTGVGPGIVITVTAPGTGGIITNTVVVTSTTADPNPANNTTTEQTTVNPPGVAQADLSIAKVDEPDPVAAGAILTYTLTIINAGPDPATGVTVTDTLPVEVTYGGASGAGWSCGHVGGEVTCTRPSLGTGVAPDIIITVTAPGTSGVIINTAAVFAQEPDPNQGNNSAQATTQVKRVYYVYLPSVSRSTE